MTVAPSPLNGVKLELALALCVMLALWLAVDRWISDWLLQAGVLSAGAVTAAAWIVLRARRVLQHYGAVVDQGPSDATRNRNS